jgi:tetratricopeptide (TPR) repeat protein
MANPNDAGRDIESEIWNAISAFEQIVEAIPNDRASLDALSHAYEQIGDLTRAKDYLLRFARVLLDEEDAVACRELLPKISKYAEQDAEMAETALRMQRLIHKAEEEPAEPSSAGAAVPAAPSPVAPSSFKFNLSEEMSFAWNLSESHQITADEYSSIVQDLTEISASAATTTVSVLHILENRSFKNIDKVIAHVSGECNAPFILLSSFSITKAAFGLLPAEFMLRRGVLIFDLLGQDALGVTMNPYNLALRKEVESIVGRTCHFFMTLPSEFDRVLSKSAEIMAQQED